MTAAQIIAVVKQQLSSALDANVFTMAETEKTRSSLLRSRWTFTLVKEQGVYTVIMGKIPQSAPNSISPILHAALRAAAAAEQLHFHVREGWDRSGYTELSIMV